MTPSLHTVHRLLKHNGIPHEVVTGASGDPHHESIQARFPGEEGEEISVLVTVGADGVFFAATIRDLTEEQIPLAEAFADALHRSVRTGLFTVSHAEKKFGFTAYRLPGDQPPTAEELAPLLFTCPMMARLYGPAFDLVAEGVSIDAALDAVEKTDGKPVMSFMLPSLPGRPKPETFDESAEEEEPFCEDYPAPYDAELDRDPVTDMVREYYDAQNWKYEFDPAAKAFRMRMSSTCVDSYQVITFIRDEEWFTTLTVFPIRIPGEKRPLIEELIARANFGMILGCFEIQPKNGLLQFRNTCLCGDAELDMAVLERHIDVGFRMCNRYGPAILEVLYGGVSPADAVRKAEADVPQKNDGLPDAAADSQSDPAVTGLREDSDPVTPVSAKKGFFRRFLERIGVIVTDSGEGGGSDAR